MYEKKCLGRFIVNVNPILDTENEYPELYPVLHIHMFSNEHRSVFVFSRCKCFQGDLSVEADGQERLFTTRQIFALDTGTREGRGWSIIELVSEYSQSADFMCSGCWVSDFKERTFH
jgi:hypothetical protein